MVATYRMVEKHPILRALCGPSQLGKFTTQLRIWAEVGQRLQQFVTTPAARAMLSCPVNRARSDISSI